MIERILFDLAETRFVRTCVALVNRLPCPGNRFPVRVYGFRMYAPKFDRYLSLWLRRLGLSETAECRLVAQLCKPGMRVADLGANLGFYSLLLARCAGPAGRVWSFEPDPDNFAMLRRNIEANGFTTIATINKAVGAATGTNHLYLSDIHTGDHRTYPSEQGRKAVPVDVVALDDFFPPEQPLDLIKMDVQGFEGKTLEGMRRILTSHREVTILMEFWPLGLRQAGSEPEEVLQGLLDRGLRLEVFDERTGVLQPLESPARLTAALPGNRYTNILASPAR